MCTICFILLGVSKCSLRGRRWKGEGGGERNLGTRERECPHEPDFLPFSLHSRPNACCAGYKY